MFKSTFFPFAIIAALAFTLGACSTSESAAETAATETVDLAEEAGDAAQAGARATAGAARTAAAATADLAGEGADVAVMGAESVADLAQSAWQEARGVLGMDGVADDARVAVAQVMTAGGATNDVRGTVTFVETADGVRARYDLMGLQPGRHGFHVHAGGSCAAADTDGDGMMEPAGAAGDHLSPDDDDHGAPGDAMSDKHAGDLGNVMVSADGTADGGVTVQALAFEGDRSVLGRTIIVHSGADEFMDSGAMAGSPVGCGVIRLSRRSM